MHSLFPQAGQAPINSSRFFSRWISSGASTSSPTRAEQLNELLGLSLTPAIFAHFLQIETNFNQSTGKSGVSLAHGLRRLRNLVVCTLIQKDLSGTANLAEVVEVMSAFADFAIQTALTALSAEMHALYGVPVSAEAAEPQQLIVVGMGKLGGKELNISSDIDLIFVYADDGYTQTDPAHPEQRSLSNHEFFNLLGKKLIVTLSEIGEDGFTFRVDMALRPNGASGPLVASFTMLERYLLTQGREWERYAWVKARAVTGLPQQIAQLRKIVQPFVYRRYLDFTIIDALRTMHSQIRAEVIRQETRHPDRANNIKLGRGGIREIEFITQVFQLIRGGREPALRNCSTRETLVILANMGIVEPEIVRQLTQSYIFLRNLEHRLQYLDDAQTHSIPALAADRDIIAQMMGYPGSAELMTELARHRAFVSHQFDMTFRSSKTEAPEVLINFFESDIEELLQLHLSRLGFHDAATATQKILQWWQSSRIKSLSEVNKNKCSRLLNRALCMIATLPESTSVSTTPSGQHNVTLLRCLNFFDAIVRRSAYLSLLIEYPPCLERLVRMLHVSEWAAQYLTRHPILLDELLDQTTLHQTPDWSLVAQELDLALSHHIDDTERQLETLREIHHIQLFRLLAQDLDGSLRVEQLADQLSQLADIMVAATVHAIWLSMDGRHRDIPLFAVVAYGKLGGKELGYASDLDLVFLYDDPDPEAPIQYARLAQRFITWMTSHTPAGILFDIDIALRPDGASGLIVSSIHAFERYQTNSAWIWEHQALTRARCCTGPEALVRKFDALRNQILCQPRDPQRLKHDVATMRSKMHKATPSHIDPSRNPTFDLKQSKGGMIDIEFMVQYLVLLHAHDYPELCANHGNIALLLRCSELGLISSKDAHAVADIYRYWRKLQHYGRLQGNDLGLVDAKITDDKAHQVIALWNTLLG